jgi:hypothetical protein
LLRKMTRRNVKNPTKLSFTLSLKLPQIEELFTFEHRGSLYTYTPPSSSLSLRSPKPSPSIFA